MQGAPDQGFALVERKLSKTLGFLMSIFRAEFGHARKGDQIGPEGDRGKRERRGFEPQITQMKAEGRRIF